MDQATIYRGNTSKITIYNGIIRLSLRGLAEYAFFKDWRVL